MCDRDKVEGGGSVENNEDMRGDIQWEDSRVSHWRI